MNSTSAWPDTNNVAPGVGGAVGVEYVTVQGEMGSWNIIEVADQQKLYNNNNNGSGAP